MSYDKELSSQGPDYNWAGAGGKSPPYIPSCRGPRYSPTSPDYIWDAGGISPAYDSSCRGPRYSPISSPGYSPEPAPKTEILDSTEYEPNEPRPSTDNDDGNDRTPPPSAQPPKVAGPLDFLFSDSDTMSATDTEDDEHLTEVNATSKDEPLRRKIRHLKEWNSNLMSEIEDWVDENDELISENEDLMSTNTRLSEKIEALSKENTELKALVGSENEILKRPHVTLDHIDELMDVQDKLGNLTRDFMDIEAAEARERSKKRLRVENDSRQDLAYPTPRRKRRRPMRTESSAQTQRHVSSKRSRCVVM